MIITLNSETGEYNHKLSDADMELSPVEIERILMQMCAALIAIGAKGTFATEEMQKMYVMKIADIAMDMIESGDFDDEEGSDGENSDVQKVGS